MWNHELVGVVLCALALTSCHGEVQIEGRSTSSTSASQAPSHSPPPAPECAHETCAERPKWLRCVETHYFNPSTVCVKFEIDYGHHCVCDAWKPAVATKLEEK